MGQFGSYGRRRTRGTGGISPIPRPPTTLGQPLPGPEDVSMPPRRGLGSWAGNTFMGFLDWLVGFDRIGTQAVGGISQGLSTGEWDFDYNWWEYTDEKDPHAALSSGAQIATNAAQGALLGAAAGGLIAGPPGALIGGIGAGVVGAGVGLWQYMNLDLIPDTPEQAAEALRERANRIIAETNSPLKKKAAELLPLLASLWNEHTMAEMAFSPLFFLPESVDVIRKSATGAHIATGISRAGSRVLRPIRELPVVAPLADWAEKTVFAVPFRRMQAKAEETGMEMGAQFAAHNEALVEGMEALRKTVGNDDLIEMADAMSHIIERSPKTQQITQEVAEKAMREILAAGEVGDTLPFARIPKGGVPGEAADATARYRWLLDEMRGEFPMMPEAAIEHSAHLMNDRITTDALQLAYANIKGIPMSSLNDIQYIYHLTTPGARTALRSAVGDMTGDALEEWYRAQGSLQNVLGKEISGLIHGRTIRKPLEAINKYSEAGRAGYVRGKPGMYLLEPGKFDEALLRQGTLKVDGKVIGDWIPIKGNIFETDVFTLGMARDARTVRAVMPLDFMREAGTTFGTTVAKPGYHTIHGVMSGTEWKQTFEAMEKAVNAAKKTGQPLSESLQTTEKLLEVAKKTYFPDTQTVKAVMAHYNMFRAVERKPGLVLRWAARFKRLWGPMTLTSWTSTANRNLIGGMIINLQDLGAAAPYFIFKAASGINRGVDVLEPARHGLFRGNFTTEIYRAGRGTLDVTPLAPTSLGSFFKGLASKKTWFPWKMGDEGGFLQRLRATDANEMYWGNTLYQYIDHHQRYVSYLGNKARGMNPKDAVRASKKLHIDYADVPPWYNELRPLLAFPTWACKMLPIQAKLLWENPAWYSMAARHAIHSQEATGFDPTLTPEIIKEGGGFGVPTMDPDQPLWFRPENFDPIAIWSDISDPFKFGYDMFNPLVSEPIEQAMQAKRTAGYGGPSSWDPKVPLITSGGESVGYDPFLDRPIVRGYTEFNKALPLVGGKKMPAWAQRVDHAMRGFLRHYSEFSSVIKTAQRDYLEQEENIAEIAARRGMGIPTIWQDMNRVVYFNLRGVDQDIHQEETRSTQRPEVLKDLYLQKLALLAHGTFAQQDPFSDDLRHWADYGREEDEFTLAGRRPMWQSAIETCWLLLMGSRSPMGAFELQQEIPLDQTEEDYLEGLLYRLLDTYQIEVGNAAARGEAEYERSIGYVEDRREALR